MSTCSVHNCGRSAHTRGMCQGHYLRAWRAGNFPPRVRQDLTGRRFGALVALEFVAGRSVWLCRCDCGQTTRVPTRDLTAGNTSSCGCRRTARKDGPVGYQAAHDRLTVDLGPATDRECSDCGRPAAHWSYDHADPDELTDWRGLPYSLEASHYAPRCHACHRRLDASAARRRRAAG